MALGQTCIRQPIVVVGTDQHFLLSVFKLEYPQLYNDILTIAQSISDQATTPIFQFIFQKQRRNSYPVLMTENDEFSTFTRHASTDYRTPNGKTQLNFKQIVITFST